MHILMSRIVTYMIFITLITFVWIEIRKEEKEGDREGIYIREIYSREGGNQRIVV